LVALVLALRSYCREASDRALLARLDDRALRDLGLDRSLLSGYERPLGR
jgi:uncharacterized protein YjiS (DUF1127 family)